MRKRLILLFDIAVLAGFGGYLALTVWRLPVEMRHKLLASSFGMLVRLTGLSG